LDVVAELIDESTCGRVFANDRLNRYLINRHFHRDIISDVVDLSSRGTVVYTAGCGGDDLVLVAGVHGNELPSQVALVRLLSMICNDEVELNSTLHIVPFLVPRATDLNVRFFEGVDLNRSAHLDSVSREIVDYAVDVNASALCDCHSTDPGNKPGIKCVFCSVSPMLDSLRIAKHVCGATGSSILPVGRAGSVIRGAVEDECNLRGVPAVTCEVVCEFGTVNDVAVDESYSQIVEFLNYFDAVRW